MNELSISDDYSSKELKKMIVEHNKKYDELIKLANEQKEAIYDLKRLLKPYVAAVSSYSGGGEMAFDNLDKAENKYCEYRSKMYFRNGLNYGVYLYQWYLEDHKISRRLIKVERLNNPFSFYLPEDLKEQEEGLK